MLHKDMRRIVILVKKNSTSMSHSFPEITLFYSFSCWAFWQCELINLYDENIALKWVNHILRFLGILFSGNFGEIVFLDGRIVYVHGFWKSCQISAKSFSQKISKLNARFHMIQVQAFLALFDERW